MYHCGSSPLPVLVICADGTQFIGAKGILCSKFGGANSCSTRSLKLLLFSQFLAEKAYTSVECKDPYEIRIGSTISPEHCIQACSKAYPNTKYVKYDKTSICTCQSTQMCSTRVGSLGNDIYDSSESAANQTFSISSF